MITPIQTHKKLKRKDKQLLIEGYKVMAKDSLSVIKEWENTELNNF